ncbi:hypothetical protein RESH_00735 [Rhodopirellula europaea SH398]|uniref:Uncharacterized protein n=2 Tax=Rhodopirellula europaea TaxID=1263866 RepID=M2ATK7_9BACT|nr:hypothetical protein RE6C_05948 [Rhodopirellula europaea 6C]EMI28680.1 hypothetical protein RESH_00735 [Rhodopirellula europaea SH398]
MPEGVAPYTTTSTFESASAFGANPKLVIDIRITTSHVQRLMLETPSVETL